MSAGVSHMSTASLLEHRTQVTAYGNDLFRVCGVAFPKTSEMQRQVSGAFLFGVAYAHGRVHQLPPPDVHALVITLLNEGEPHRAADESQPFSAVTIWKLMAAGSHRRSWNVGCRRAHEPVSDSSFHCRCPAKGFRRRKYVSIVHNSE